MKLQSLTKKILKEGIKNFKEDVTENNPDYDEGKDVQPTQEIFDADFLRSSMKMLVNLVSNKMTEIKRDTIMGEKYIDFKENEYEQKIVSDFSSKIHCKREANTLIFTGIPNLKKRKDGSLEIEDFEGEISVLQNTAVDYSTPEEMAQYLFGIILKEEIL